jgi:hypothetical protein
LPFAEESAGQARPAHDIKHACMSQSGLVSDNPTPDPNRQAAQAGFVGRGFRA